MKYLLIAVLLWAAGNVQGQDTAAFRLSADSDTIFWSNYHLRYVEQLELLHPKGNTDFYRVILPGGCIEISGTQTGKVVFKADEIWDKILTDDCFVQTFPLTENQVQHICHLIDTLMIDSIPSDKYIRQWHRGFDGVTYCLESRTGTVYSFKRYWTPSVQGNFREANLIAAFIEQLNIITGYTDKRKIFEAAIPFYGWTSNNGTITMRVVSDSEHYNKYKRLKKKQLKQKAKMEKGRHQ
ncbi:hypothetical protein [Chitinophaga solisilvae]|uniref:hypothetical protein n=1 Tax=Chitinophaga solisilvae TaxID=1233460 RepID=UPI00136992E9|nr:hypothetical protein [Chitinophaga solisilvae]